MAASRPSRDPETSAVADPRTDRDEPLDGANYPRLAALEQSPIRRTSSGDTKDIQPRNT